MNISEIDLITLDQTSNTVCLSVIDDLNWDDIDEHLVTLQEKLLYYVNYIEKEEVTKKYPSISNLDVNIKVVFEHDPPEVGDRFIKQAMLILKETGYNLSYCNFHEGA